MKKIDNSVKITGIIVSAVLVMFLLVFSTFNSVAARKTVNIQGEATIDVMPDIVEIRFTVRTLADTSQEAKDENSRIVNDVVDSLIQAGIPREDIETLNLNIYEEYDWTEDGRKSKGFRATHDIRVEFGVDEYPEIGQIVDAGIDAGALLNYINFELSPELESEYTAQALELAGEDARNKAVAMASGVGGKLGKLVSVSDQTSSYYPWTVYRANNMEAGVAADKFDESTPIQVGERQITARISVVYEIK
jgi:hypothetical protein